MKILLVQEDIEESKYLENILQDLKKEEELVIKTVGNFKTALEEVYYSNHNILLIDSKVKNIRAKDFCIKVRNSDNKIGIICVSDDNDSDTKIDLLKIGADDYIVKPFVVQELLFKIKNLYKRVEATEIVKRINLDFYDYSLDTMKRELKRADEIINLTFKEFSLLEYFVRNKNIAITRADIKKEIWGESFRTKTNIVDVYINKLRKKIDDESGKILQTVRGKGYILKM